MAHEYPGIGRTWQRAMNEARLTFTDPRLPAAIVDRITCNGTIIETGRPQRRGDLDGIQSGRAHPDLRQ
ncbi:hypothetical protein ACWGQ5_49510 [Streptomyces sp. NPDC055722]